MDEKPESYCWSRDGERYEGDFPTRAAALAAGAADAAENEAAYGVGPDVATVWTGRSVPPDVGLTDDAADVLERLADTASESDCLAEFFDEDWPDVKRGSAAWDALEAICERFRAEVATWIETHAKPAWFLVEDVEKHEATIGPPAVQP